MAHKPSFILPSDKVNRMNSKEKIRERNSESTRESNLINK